jgi:hypothetical protein
MVKLLAVLGETYITHNIQECFFHMVELSAIYFSRKVLKFEIHGVPCYVMVQSVGRPPGLDGIVCFLKILGCPSSELTK